MLNCRGTTSWSRRTGRNCEEAGECRHRMLWNQEAQAPLDLLRMTEKKTTFTIQSHFLDEVKKKKKKSTRLVYREDKG